MSTKQAKINSFNPDEVGQDNGKLFGLPFDPDDSELVIVPVAWDVTVSYGAGTAEGPEAVLAASPQLDFNDPDFPDAWKVGFSLDHIDESIREQAKLLRPKAETYISFLENGGRLSENTTMQQLLAEINFVCKATKEKVKQRVSELFRSGKKVAVLGGDHSTPLGMIEALAERYDAFGILQIDAHLDLREAYEGFEYSHASVMFNALKNKQVKKLVQVGIRDYCKSESDLIASEKGRVKVFFDRDMKNALYEGKVWKDICMEIISELPEYVYISFDIDGLDPKLCPNTGTPVPGGLEFEQAVYLFRKLIESGKKIIAFDLNEVSPGEDDWDANVGARMLWKLCVFLSLSNELK